MSKKTHLEEVEAELEELLDFYKKESKLETLLYQRGLLSGWLARIAATDYIVLTEIRDRIEQAKKKTQP